MSWVIGRFPRMAASKKNKNKFYKAEMLKSFPKKSHFYHAENSKSAKKDAMNNISVSMKKKEKSTMEC